MKTNIGKLLVALVLATLVMTSGLFVAFAQMADKTEPVVARKVPTVASTDRPVSDVVRTLSVNQFSGSGFIMSEDGKRAEPIRIVAVRNGGVFPTLTSIRAVDVPVGEPVPEDEDVVTEDTFVKRAREKLGTSEFNWKGTITIGVGNLQERFLLYGVEKSSVIEFAVVPTKPVLTSNAIGELEVKRMVFPSIELWQGELGINSVSNFNGKWKFTAFSHRIAFGKIMPVPLEISRGAEVEVGDYVIKAGEIRRQRILFGFIPIGKEVAIVEIYKDGKLIAEKTLAEGEIVEIDDLILRVVKINGKLKVVPTIKE